MAVAHLAFQFGARHQRRDRVDHQHVDGAGAHQRVGDLQRLLAGIRLGDQQLVDVDAQLAGIGRVERVLRIDEGAGAAGLLGLGDGVQGQRGLARAFRPVDFNDAALRQAADTQRDVETERAGGNHLRLDQVLLGAELHDRALAERAFDLAQGGIERLLLVHGILLDQTKLCGRHARYPSLRTHGRRSCNEAECTLFVLVCKRRCCPCVPILPGLSGLVFANEFAPPRPRHRPSRMTSFTLEASCFSEKGLGRKWATSTPSISPSRSSA